MCRTCVAKAKEQEKVREFDPKLADKIQDMESKIVTLTTMVNGQKMIIADLMTENQPLSRDEIIDRVLRGIWRDPDHIKITELFTGSPGTKNRNKDYPRRIIKNFLDMVCMCCEVKEKNE